MRRPENEQTIRTQYSTNICTNTYYNIHFFFHIIGHMRALSDNAHKHTHPLQSHFICWPGPTQTGTPPNFGHSQSCHWCSQHNDPIHPFRGRPRNDDYFGRFLCARYYDVTGIGPFRSGFVVSGTRHVCPHESIVHIRIRRWDGKDICVMFARRWAKRSVLRSRKASAQPPDIQIDCARRVNWAEN